MRGARSLLAGQVWYIRWEAATEPEVLAEVQTSMNGYL